jgi:tetratricopeptide (TPR) repeat protein
MQAKEYEKALQAYEKVLVLAQEPDFPLYPVLYNIAVLKELLKKSSAEVVSSYCKAAQSNLFRAEALFRLAEHCFIKNQHAVGYAIAKQALLIPNPHERIYNEDWIYEYGLLFVLGNCASGLGKYREAILLYEEVLTKPSLTADMLSRVRSNLAYAKERAKLGR